MPTVQVLLCCIHMIQYHAVNVVTVTYVLTSSCPFDKRWNKFENGIPRCYVRMYKLYTNVQTVRIPITNNHSYSSYKIKIQEVTTTLLLWSTIINIFYSSLDLLATCHCRHFPLVIIVVVDLQ